VAELRERFNSLTSREREVLSLVVTGRPNKQIAAQLELSEMTVKVHRSQITRKMRSKSLSIWCEWPTSSAFRSDDRKRSKQALVASSVVYFDPPYVGVRLTHLNANPTYA